MRDAPPIPPSLAPCVLHAGPVSLWFEPATLWTRWWRIGGVEILRAVYPAVRDTRWSTLRPQVGWLSREIGARRFSLVLSAVYGHPRPSLDLRLMLKGGDDGCVRICATGEVRRTFATNRTGLCVLHPAEVAGRACRLEHTDGSVEFSRLPQAVSPHQPFQRLRAIAHRSVAGRVEVRMEGDTFETEDQRNWTDASFKTYSRPLAEPFPYTLRRGARVEQSVVVRCTGHARRRPARAPQPEPVALKLSGIWRKPLSLGVGLTHRNSLPKALARRLDDLGLGHFRAELDVSSPDCVAEWSLIVTRMKVFRPGTALALTLLIPSSGGKLTELVRGIAAAPAPFPVRWTVLDRDTGTTTATTFCRVASLWTRHHLPGLLGGGVRGDFVGLNRHRPLIAGMEFACFGFDPQVHAFDDASVLETTTVHAELVRQASRLLGGLPIAVEPVTLGVPREAGGKATAADRRQFTPFAAVWTLASLSAIVAGGAVAATFHGTVGPTGLFADRAGASTPLARLFAACDIRAARRITSLRANHTSAASGLALRRADGLRLLIANHLPESSPVRIVGLPPGDASARIICAAGRDRPMLRRTGAQLHVALPARSIMQLDLPTPS